MTTKILCVDDEARVLSGLRRTLRGKFELEFAEGPRPAMELLESAGPFAVVLADMRMPVMDGAKLLARVRRDYPDTVRIMLSGNSDQETAIRAVNEGHIFRFLTKPCGAEELSQALQAGLEQYRMVCAEREVLEQTLSGSVKVLTEILALTDPASFRVSDELKELAGTVARELGLLQPWEVEMAAMLSQLGRVTVPAEILARADAGATLDEDELRMMESIPTLGARLIAEIPRLQGVAEIVEQQARDWSPTEADSVPVGARILRTLHDMTALGDSGFTRCQALTHLRRESDVHDLEVVAAVAECVGVGIQGVNPSAHEIPFDELKPGDILAAPLITRDGRMMLGEGQCIGQVLLERLRNHQQLGGFHEPLQVLDTPPKSDEKEERKAS